MSLLIHRPAHVNLATFHQATYYLGAYVAGMFASRHRQQIEPWLRRWWLPLAALLGFMDRWYTRRIRPVDLVSELSFPIFFVHAYLIFRLTALHPMGATPGGLGAYLLTVLLATLGAVLLVVAVRRVAGSKSRWIIGA